jgi:hypothetical protein
MPPNKIADGTQLAGFDENSPVRIETKCHAGFE